jgi:tape measure domain-containing protein
MSKMSLDYVINLLEGNFGKNMKAAQAQTNKLDNTFKRLATTAAAAFSIRAAGQIVSEAVQVNAAFEGIEQQIKATSNSTVEYEKNIAFLEKTVKNLNAPLKATYNQFSILNGAVRNTVLEGDAARRIFENFSIASRALKLDAQQKETYMQTFTNMLNTNNVSMQDFTQRLKFVPGILKTAATSMGMSVDEFGSAVSKNQINVQEFVLKLSETFRGTFIGDIPDAMNTTRATMDGLENETLKSMRAIGQASSGAYITFMQVKIKVLNLLAKALEFYDRNRVFINRLAGATLVLAGVIGTYMAVMKAATVVTSLMIKLQGIYRVVTLASAVATSGLKAAWIALNVAFGTSPIGMIITLVGLLVAGLVIAYQTSDRFRAALAGLGQTGLSVIKAMYNALLLMISPITVAVGFLTSGPAGAKKALERIKQDTIDYMKATNDIYGSAFNRGYNNSMAKSKAGQTDNALDTLGQDGFDLTKALADISSSSGGTGGGQSVSSGRSVRNISVRIDKQIFDLQVNTTTVKESMGDIKRLMQDAINRAILDLEAGN